jgi:exodeoxyribonuclease VII large subunit
VLTVGDVALRIEKALRDGIPAALKFQGEVGGFRDRTHWYFDLKDDKAVVSCVVFASVAKRLGFTPVDGQQVIASGRVEFYAKGGKVSVILDSLQPAGQGERELALRKLIETLRARGWLDPSTKKPLPTFPRRVAVVTSATGAALQDVLRTMRERCPGVGVLVCDVRVQGEHAAPEIAAMLGHLSVAHAQLGVDAILLTRGGGSMEDLWCFNELVVAQAIRDCQIPLVAAIGHETDTTIAELVADERCATPTHAAMRLTPDRQALARQLLSISMRLNQGLRASTRDAEQRSTLASMRLKSAMQGVVRTHATRLERLTLRLERQKPQAVHARLIARLHSAQRALHAAAAGTIARSRLSLLRPQIARAMTHRLALEHARLQSALGQLHMVSPTRVLERGYSVTLRADGTAVRAPTDVAPGQSLTTRLAEGTIRSTVDGSASAPKLAPKRRPKPADNSPTLFA